MSPVAGGSHSRVAVPARAGIGLRAPHHAQILEQRPPIAWLEAHSENYFAAGGLQPRILEQLRKDYPLALHGVGLSLGSADPLDLEHIAALKRLIERVEPAIVSEHLCWGAIGGRHLNDLLPMPYEIGALRHIVSRIAEFQERIGRQVLIENVSSYLRFTGETHAEWEFLVEVSRAADCLLLVDVNNIFVNARNHGFEPRDYLDAIPAERVGEIHLAGHTLKTIDTRELRIDTHSSPVCEEVWALYAHALQRFGPVPTLIEWDAELPELSRLLAEAEHADALAG